jgi:hypothetical protein
MTKLTEHGLFSSRDTLEEALEYANGLISARIPAEYRMEALTALHVCTNTAIKLLSATTPSEEILPFTKEELTTLEASVPEPYRVSDLTPHQVRRFVRTRLPELVAIAEALSEIHPPFETMVGHFCCLVAAEYQVPHEKLADEAAPFMAKIKLFSLLTQLLRK